MIGREKSCVIEKKEPLELSDRDLLEKLRLSSGGLVFTDVMQEHPKSASPEFKKETKVVDLREKNAESKSESIKKKSKKNHSKCNKTAVASMEKKL